MKKILKLFGLAVGLGAVICAVYSLLSAKNRCLIIFEPNPIIRITEIIMGLIAIPILFKIMIEK